MALTKKSNSPMAGFFRNERGNVTLIVGFAVIPLVLGLGCSTMATSVTRTLETKRERMVCTMLLALAIPCSAQLGVILALLSGQSRTVFVRVGEDDGELEVHGRILAAVDLKLQNLVNARPLPRGVARVDRQSLAFQVRPGLD